MFYTTHMLPLVIDNAPKCLALSKDDALQKKAMHMYFSGILAIEIAQYLNVEMSELSTYVYGEDGRGMHPNCWCYQMQSRPNVSVVSYQEVKPYVLKHTEALLIEKVRKSVDELHKDNIPLSMDDMDIATKMIERIDRITRLEEGKATEHVAIQHKTFSLREIAEQAGQDKALVISPDDYHTLNQPQPDNAPESNEIELPINRNPFVVGEINNDSNQSGDQEPSVVESGWESTIRKCTKEG